MKVDDTATANQAELVERWSRIRRTDAIMLRSVRQIAERRAAAKNRIPALPDPKATAMPLHRHLEPVASRLRSRNSWLPRLSRFGRWFRRIAVDFLRAPVPSTDAAKSGIWESTNSAALPTCREGHIADPHFSKHLFFEARKDFPDLGQQIIAVGSAEDMDAALVPAAGSVVGCGFPGRQVDGPDRGEEIGIEEERE
jgi:hypothetical protein